MWIMGTRGQEEDEDKKDMATLAGVTEGHPSAICQLNRQEQSSLFCLFLLHYHQSSSSADQKWFHSSSRDHQRSLCIDGQSRVGQLSFVGSFVPRWLVMQSKRRPTRTRQLKRDIRTRGKVEAKVEASVQEFCNEEQLQMRNYIVVTD